jgi:aspartate/methionine/tyrosine aminotransferase
VSKVQVGSRLSSIKPFKAMQVLRRAGELESQGYDVIHMEVGEPSFPTPAPIVAAGQTALSQGQTKYTDARGIVELREAISEYYRSDYGLEISEERIFVTSGGSGALLLSTALLLNPGENIIMGDPGYPCNRHFMTVFSGSATLVPVGVAEDYQLNESLLRAHWQESTRGVLLASPANPTGALINETELTSMSSFISKKNGYLISDEIYHGLVYADDNKMSALNVCADAFVVNSFSKYFGMTGWRLGWLIAPTWAVDEVEKLAQNLFICPSSIAQHAAVAAFSPAAREIMESQREALRTRRDFLLPALRELGFSIPREPDGAFYIYAGIPEGFSDCETFTNSLLEHHHVAITPGTDFGNYLANRHVRFSYTTEMDRLRGAVDRLAKAMQTSEFLVDE